MDILLNALRDAQGAFSNKRAALRGSLSDKTYSLWDAIMFILFLLSLA